MKAHVFTCERRAGRASSYLETDAHGGDKFHRHDRGEVGIHLANSEAHQVWRRSGHLQGLQTLLRQHLASLVVLFERDPGLDAATTDLYATAAAVVNDTTMASQPLARKRRLLNEAQTRFQERIATARPN
jgi:hypothetical protein